MRRNFGFIFTGKARNWQLAGGILLIMMGVILSLQPLAQAYNDPGLSDNTSSVRPEVSDLEMFGKKLSTDKPLFQSLAQAELKPSNDPVQPSRLRIPAIEVDTLIEEVGLRDGNMDVPNNIWNVGWLKNSPKPGEAGNAVLAGHRDSVAGTAVFWNLNLLKAGEKVYVSDGAGNELTFEVTEVQSYSLTDAPMLRIFGPADEKQLNLITCDGTFVRQDHTYDHRLVVFTKLVEN
jgi:LPXTG-site transpeptidase (sortase) family protein